MAVDLVIKNGQCVLPEGITSSEVGVAIAEGRIQAIGHLRYLPEAREVIDATGQYVLPGLIDPHVHTREPGFAHKEELVTCTQAGAAGGITTMLAMFNLNPPIMDVDGFDYFVELCSKKSLINFNAIGIVTETNAEQIVPLAQAGISALKVILGYKFDVSGGAGRPDVKGVSCPEDGGLVQAMQIIAGTGVPLVAHAENDSIIHRLQTELRAKGEIGPAAHIASRPSVAEEEAISRLITFNRFTGGKLHILHLGNGRGLQLVRDAQREGLEVTAETCPHYLTLTNDEHVLKLGTVGKMNPPIRTAWDRDRLWGGVADGTVTVIGTDHSPHTPEEKMVDRPFEDMFKAMAGFVGIETNVPIMLTHVNQGRLSLERLVQLSSTNPARLFGLSPDRGTLHVGGAGDVTIVDLKPEWQIDARKLHSKTRVTPFDGMQVQGRPTYTIVNGKVVYANGTILGQPGDGQFIRAQHRA